jgi:hypothetical protein
LIIASDDAGRRPPAGSGKSAEQAAVLADEHLDKMGDPTLPAEERQTRKRRLIKGPKELLDVRTDQPKPVAGGRRGKRG